MFPIKLDPRGMTEIFHDPIPAGFINQGGGFNTSIVSSDTCIYSNLLWSRQGNPSLSNLSKRSIRANGHLGLILQTPVTWGLPPALNWNTGI